MALRGFLRVATFMVAIGLGADNRRRWGEIAMTRLT